MQTNTLPSLYGTPGAKIVKECFKGASDKDKRKRDIHSPVFLSYWALPSEKNTIFRILCSVQISTTMLVSNSNHPMKGRYTRIVASSKYRWLSTRPLVTPLLTHWSYRSLSRAKPSLCTGTARGPCSASGCPGSCRCLVISSKRAWHKIRMLTTKSLLISMILNNISSFTTLNEFW